MLVDHGADVARLGPDAAVWGVTNGNLATLNALDQAALPWLTPYPARDGNVEPIPFVDTLVTQALHGVTTPAILDFLFRRGASPSLESGGRSLLHWFVVWHGTPDLKVMDALLATNIDVNARDGNGATALMYAAGRNHAEACECMLAKGADPALWDLLERTAADWAAARGSVAALKVLRRRTLRITIPHRKLSEIESNPALAARTDDFLLLDTRFTLMRWEGVFADLESALSMAEQRFGWSRSPVGPFPVLRVIRSGSSTDCVADPFASQCEGAAMVGDVLVLTLAAVAISGPGDPVEEAMQAKPDPRPIFAISGVFDKSDADTAAAFAREQKGWSMIVRLEALPVLEDGWRKDVTWLDIKELEYSRND